MSDDILYSLNVLRHFLAGRVVRTIENYTEDPSGGLDENVTVETTYTPENQVSTLTAKNSQTGDQVTRYVYGTTRADSDADVSPADSGVARDDLLVAEIFPDAVDPTESFTASWDTWNRLIKLNDAKQIDRHQRSRGRPHKITEERQRLSTRRVALRCPSATGARTWELPSTRGRTDVGDRVG